MSYSIPLPCSEGLTLRGKSSGYIRAGKGSEGQSQEGSVTVNIGDFINHHTFNCNF